MKEFYYEWPQDIYLLHLEMSSKNRLIDYSLGRVCNGVVTVQKHTISTINGAYRFIISRKSSKEKGVLIKYNADVVLKAFLVYDRAFYPTTPFFEQ